MSLGASAILVEEAAPLVGGLGAEEGHLAFALVVLSISIATWSFSLLLYFIGRWHGDWVRERFPRIRAPLLRTLRFVRNHPWRSGFAVRFAFGLRLALPISCGAAGLRLWVFMVATAVGSVVWSTIFTGIGWAFGDVALRLLGEVKRYEKWLALAIVIGVAIAFYVARRRHIPERTVEHFEDVP
ncbi:MAG: associated protein [Gemmatimonadetes bacterium]|nr:associated protein [Gemmatimonadota bacterium]